MGLWFDCRHKQTSFPVTLKIRNKTDTHSGTHVVCFDCGREFPYDWDKMKVITKAAQHSALGTSLALATGLLARINLPRLRRLATRAIG
jgi:hypothetical protein